MESFGQKLRRERESREKPLEEIAGTTKIRLRFLEALETDEFDELPGPAFGKFFIRAYAEVLDLDPEPLIAEYEQERRRRAREELGESLEEPERKPRARLRWKAFTEAARKKDEVEEAAPEEEFHEETSPDHWFDSESESEDSEVIPEPELEPEPEPPPEPELEAEPAATAAPEREPVAEPEPVEQATPVEEVTPVESVAAAREHMLAGTAARNGRRISFVGATVGTVIVIVWLVAALTSPRQTLDDPTVNVAAIQTEEKAGGPEPAATVVTDAAAPEPAAAEPETVAPPPKPQPQPRTPRSTDGLSVEAFGVGTDVVNRRLIGQADRFSEGASAAFWTRVIGGASGDTVRHVWLREGKVMQSVNLRIGGPHWRTHSRKTLWGVGEWAVEAHGADGRVLARATFVCVPRGS